MKITKLGTNLLTLETPTATVLVSYATPVAAWLRNGCKYVRSAERFSVTTTKHINAWLKTCATIPIVECDVVPQAEIAALLDAAPAKADTTRSIVVNCQYRENYGAHQWDGEGKCPQYWKCKGGISFIVRNVPMGGEDLINDVITDTFTKANSMDATDNPTWVTLTDEVDLSDLQRGKGSEYEWAKLLKEHQDNIGWERRYSGGEYSRTEPFGS